MFVLTPAHPQEEVNTKRVRLAPAPRRVRLLLPPKSMQPVKGYAPAFKSTVCPAAQLASAELICAAVAPGFSVAQFVVRAGIPPTTPAPDQFVALVGFKMPVQSCWARPAVETNEASTSARKNRNGRTDLIFTSVMC